MSIKRAKQATGIFSKNKRGALWTPFNVILMILATIYLLFPIDAIPDALPILGLLDDLGVITIIICWVSSRVSKVIKRAESEEKTSD